MSLKPLTPLAILIFVCTVATATRSAEPVNPQLIPEARRVLNYLETVYGKKTLAGMSSYGGWRPVFEISGRAPAIYALDAFGWNPPKWGDSYNRVLQNAIDSALNWWHEKGGPDISGQFHWGRAPATPMVRRL